MSSGSPTLVLGARGGVSLFEPRLGVSDLGVTGVPMLVRSHRLAPAGAGGACVFRTLWLAVRHQLPQTIEYRVLVDDLEVVSGVLALAAQPTVRSYTALVALSIPLLVDGVERSRQRPQGTWIQVQFGTDDTGAFAIDGLDVEWEQVQRRES